MLRDVRCVFVKARTAQMLPRRINREPAKIRFAIVVFISNSV
jgi:hypothetical protein